MPGEEVEINISEMRGEIINKFLELENLVEQLITIKIFGFLYPRFIFNTLTGFTIYKKIELLTGIYEGDEDIEEILKELDRLRVIRNTFAHNMLYYHWGTQPVLLKHTGVKEEKIKNQDVMNLYNEFMKTYPHVHKQLKKVKKDFDDKEFEKNRDKYEAMAENYFEEQGA